MILAAAVLLPLAVGLWLLAAGRALPRASAWGLSVAVATAARR